MSGLARVPASSHFSRDRKLVVTVDSEWSTINDVLTGKVVYRHRLGPKALRSNLVCFSGDNRFIAESTASQVEIRSVATGEILHKLDVADPADLTLQFARELIASPDGKLLATVRTLNRFGQWAPKAQVIVWDLSSGKKLYHFTSFDARPVFTPDSTRLVSITPNGKRVMVRDSRKGNQLHSSLCSETNPQSASVAVCEDGSALAVSHNNIVQLCDLRFKTQLGRLVCPAGDIGYVTFSRDGTRLATVTTVWQTDSGNTVQVWDLCTRKERLRVRLPIWYDGRLCRLSDNGTMLAIADGNAVRLWDVAKGREITQEVGHRSAIERIAVLPNSEEIGVADEFGGIRLWNTRSA